MRWLGLFKKQEVSAVEVPNLTTHAVMESTNSAAVSTEAVHDAIEAFNAKQKEAEVKALAAADTEREAFQLSGAYADLCGDMDTYAYEVLHEIELDLVEKLRKNAFLFLSGFSIIATVEKNAIRLYFSINGKEAKTETMDIFVTAGTEKAIYNAVKRVLSAMADRVKPFDSSKKVFEFNSRLTSKF